MAGFSKEAVIQALEAQMVDYTQRADETHASVIEAWEKQRKRIQRAKKNLRQAVRDLTEGRIEIEAFAKRLNDSDDRGYRYGWTTTAALQVPAPPKREPSAVEKSIASAIALVKGATGDTLTVTEMRQLGILDYVKR